jgi:protein SCO1/2
MQRGILSFVLVCVASIIGLIVFYIATTTKDFNQPVKPLSELGGDFKLSGYNGDIALSQYKGDVVVMYFGYMSCAEVCPNSMMVLTNALSRLDKQGINNTQGLFVSVDPARDTPDKIKQFTDYFHPRITGLTGSHQQVKDVGALYGVYYDSTNLSESFMEYSVSHASQFYIIVKNGELATTMSHTTTPNELAAQIKELL